MANYTGGANTICPFYIREAACSITCEGAGAAVVLMMRFPSKDEKPLWQSQYCCTFGYPRCPVAKMLLEKYGAGASGTASAVIDKAV